MKLGRWTRLLALASVAYLAITGKRPTPAVERIVSDSLVPLSQCAAGRYSAHFLRALDAAMAVKPEDRPGNVERSVGCLEERRRPVARMSTKGCQGRAGPSAFHGR